MLSDVILNIFKYEHVLMIHMYRSKDTPYAKQNGGDYDFIVEDTGALPIDQVSLKSCDLPRMKIVSGHKYKLIHCANYM